MFEDASETVNRCLNSDEHHNTTVVMKVIYLISCRLEGLGKFMG